MGLHSRRGKRIEAEDFDSGGEGVAYHDTTAVEPWELILSPWRRRRSATGGTGVVVTSTAGGEWLQYTISVPDTANYTVQARVALPSPAAHFHISFDSQTNSQVYVLPQTKGLENWQTFSSNPMALAAGVHVMHIALDQIPTG